jgi:hypothetical protein
MNTRTSILTQGAKFSTVSVCLVLLLICSNADAQFTPPYYNNVGGSSSNAFPLNSATTNKTQWIYGPGVFNTSGVTGTPAPAGMISKVYFTIGTTTSGTSVYSNFTIKMGQTVGTANQFTSNTFITNLDTAFYAVAHSLTNPITDAWQEIVLQTPFFYDPSLSLVFEICVSAGTGNSVRQQSVSIPQRLYGGYAATTGSPQNFLLNLGFELLPSMTDAGLEGFVQLPDTLCEGAQPVAVTLKNHGPNPLAGVDIEWRVNNVPQPTYSWSGNLPVIGTTQVTLGSVPFIHGTPYQISANTSNPNQSQDTINHNDTISKPEIIVKPSPSIVLNDTSIAICQGDTAWISGTLTGTPPWSFTIIDGTTQHSFAGITNSSINIPMTPATSRTYTIEAIGDATGCETATGPKITVSVQAAPPAAITPMGPPAACMGDSVMLMGSVGLNFSYQWYHDGTLVPGATNYLLAAKAGGNYTVLVTSPIGCSKLSAPYSVYIHPLPAVSLGNDTALLPHQSILLNAGTGFNSYLWSTGATSASLLVDTAGAGIGVQTIWVNVTDNNTCKGGDTILINFTPHPGIAGVSTDASLELFPNPTTGRVTLHLNRFPAGKCTVELFRPDGRAVFRKEHTVSGAEEQLTLDLQNLPAGVYLIRVNGEEISSTKKLIFN